MKSVATVDCLFRGYCEPCDETVTGRLVEGEFCMIEGKNICVIGSLGIGDCGHTTHVATGSSVWSINSKPVARVGDEVRGQIDGVIITGTFVNSD